MLGLKKKLKFTLCRNKLSKMYVTFVRPLLEYASVVWDGCSILDTDKLEKVHYMLQELWLACLF